MIDEVIPQFKHMWRENEYSFDGKYFSMPPRNVLPKPLSDPHPPMWIAAGNPGTFEKAARMGLGVLCFTTGIARDAQAAHREVQEARSTRPSRSGEYVNDNIMVTSQMLCLEDGARARDIACNMTSGYQNSLVFHYLDTFPKPAGHPRLARPDPRADARGAAAGHRQPSRHDRRRPTTWRRPSRPTRTPVPTRSCSGCSRRRCRSRSRSRPSRRSASTSSRRSTRTPSTCTQRHREAYVAKRGPRTKTTLGIAADKVPVL